MSSTAIISQDSHTVTVRMNRRRWNRLQKLEESYKVAHAIRKGLNQVEESPLLTMDEALDTLRRL